MEPQLQLNYLAMLAGVAVNVAVGFLWYGPLLGKAWAKEVGLPADFKPAPAQMFKSLALMVIGAFLTAYVLNHSTEVWRPSVWKAGEDAPAYIYGFFGGFFTWVGFYVPLMFNSVAYEGKSWKLFAINAGYYFVTLQAMAMILAYWRS